MNINFQKVNYNNQQKKIDHLDTEIQMIKNKIIGKNENSVSQNKINVKLKQNKPHEKIDIISIYLYKVGDKKIQDNLKCESKNKSIK